VLWVDPRAGAPSTALLSDNGPAYLSNELKGFLRRKEVEKQNGRLKRLVADLSLDNAILKGAISKK